LSHPPLIAVVDDDEAVRVSLEGLVRSLGYAVRTFGSAETYLESGCAPDCVVSDVQMPGMSGLDLKEALNTAGTTTPVILITAFADDAATRARADALGATCLLRKPFTADSLIGCLERALAV
jgi:FixJ family two-component response regulator